VPAITQDQYLATFLGQGDLPHLHQVQDSRLHRPDPGDTAFGAHGGLFTGLSAWMGADDAIVWRLVDIRFAFGDDASAVAYHRERLRENAEGNHGVRGAPFVGSGCAVFGGVQPAPMVPDLYMTTYFYLFRVRCLVVKLFVAQSAALKPGTLTAPHLTPIARAIEARAGSVLSTPARSEAGHDQPGA
jgi:hypothetical protein